MPIENKKTELLLPVGNMDMALAAVHNGADAIYVGFPGYNARGRAIDFEVEELREIIQTCHLYGVKTNLALNILIFPDELAKLIPLLEKILPLKPDALIIQDLGLARLIREMAPHQVLHASTQMTVTNHEAIALVEDLDIKRFVLGRENSLREIEVIQSNLQSEKDLEVFVHGALCVSYSGQCFTSESIGGRSANRGQCAQSCRFSYEMWVDGEHKNPVQKEYLVSPQDLCGVAEIPRLIELGVKSFKVEGRLKSPEYVAAVAQEYREAIDRHLAASDLSEEEVTAGKKRMATTYSRGFFSGWLHGVDHQRLVEGTGKSHRGYHIGSVIDVLDGTLVVELESPLELSPGDGLLWVYWRGSEQIEAGAQIYAARSVGPLIAGRKCRYTLNFGKDVLLSAEIQGARLYFNHDSSQKRELRRSFLDKTGFKKIPVDLTVEASVGAPLKVALTDGLYLCEALGELMVQEARNQAVTDAFLRDELGAFGGTVFTLNKFKVNRSDSRAIFYSHKELKEIRRRLTTELTRLRSENRVERYETPIVPGSRMAAWLEGEQGGREPSSRRPTSLNVLLRGKEQVFDLIAARKAGQLSGEYLDAVILDFEFGMDYEPSIRALREASIKCGIATTRILKPKEYTHFTRIERLMPDVLLIRNLGALRYFTAVSSFRGELRGDFSLNVANPLTAHYLLSKGLASVTVSYDLNSQQVSELLSATDAGRLEVTVHQYMPAFHMEHCVFAAFLSKGSSFRDCGKPCEKHRVELKDQFGNHHHLKPDPECRNTMYNATPQSAARFVDSWRKQGLGMIRYEALHERGAELIDKIRGYQDLLSGEKNAEQVIAELKPFESYGLAEGAMGKTREYQSRKKALSPR